MKRLGALATTALLACGSSDRGTASSAPAPSASGAERSLPSAPDREGLWARLPRGAAIYGSVRPSAIDTAMGWSPATARARGALADVFGPGATTRSALERIGAGGDGPIYFAMMPIDPASGRAALSAMADGKSDSEVRQRMEAAPRVLSHTRLVFAGALPSTLAKSARAALEGERPRAEVYECPGTQICPFYAEPWPQIIIHEERTIVSMRSRDGVIEVDVARFLDGTAIQGDQELRKLPTGGPEPGRCTKLDDVSGVSACVDAERMGALGSALGYSTALAAILAAPIDASQKAAIARQGLLEADKSTALSRPSRPLVDDGTITVKPRADGFDARASWKMATESTAGLTRAFATRACTRAAGSKEWLDRLGQAFGDPGADFSSFQSCVVDVRESGMPGLPVLFARGWPGCVFARGPSSEPAPDALAHALERLPGAELCASVAGDRFELTLGATLPR